MQIEASELTAKQRRHRRGTKTQCPCLSRKPAVPVGAYLNQLKCLCVWCISSKLHAYSCTLYTTLYINTKTSFAIRISEFAHGSRTRPRPGLQEFKQCFHPRVCHVRVVVRLSLIFRLIFQRPQLCRQKWPLCVLLPRYAIRNKIVTEIRTKHRFCRSTLTTAACSCQLGLLVLGGIAAALGQTQI